MYQIFSATNEQSKVSMAYRMLKKNFYDCTLLLNKSYILLEVI